MPKELEYLDVRYVIFLPTKDLEKWQCDEFIIIKSFPCLFDPEYSIAEIESVALSADALTAEDVMDVTGALAVHEEYTNGVLLTPDTLEEISDIYCWSSAGQCFIGDMLTEIEKLSVLLKHYYEEYKVVIKPEDISYNIEKEQPMMSLSGNIDVLFSNDVNMVSYKGNRGETLWWPVLIEDCGFFVVILDPDLDGVEEDEDVPIKKPEQMSLALTNCNPNSSNPWDDDDAYDDEYDTMTAWYKARGYI